MLHCSITASSGELLAMQRLKIKRQFSAQSDAQSLIATTAPFKLSSQRKWKMYFRYSSSICIG